MVDALGLSRRQQENQYTAELDAALMECVGIGSDFDGIEGNLEISDCSKVYLLEDALKKDGLSSLSTKEEGAGLTTHSLLFSVI